MVKQIIVNQGHADYIKTLAQNTQNCTAGLILGKTGSNKDYVVRLVRCPPLEEENEWQNVSNVDENWVSGHAAQVLPSLPGGVEIIGVFLVTSQAENLKDTRVKLKQMLYRSYRSITKAQEETNQFLSENTVPSIFWTVAHFDSKKGGALINCYQFDAMDYKDTGRPVEWKIQENSIQWDCISCSLFMDETINTNDAIETADILDQFSTDCCRKIANACILIDKKQRCGNEVLNSTSTGAMKTSKKKKQTQKLTCNDFQCQVFIPIGRVNKSEDFLDCTQTQTRNMKGCITGLAFLLPGTTVEEAVSCLKRDLLMSVRQRFQLLHEDFAQSGDVHNSNTITLPMRCFCCDTSEKQGDRIIYSEYVLPGEPHDEYIDRISDNLDLKLIDIDQNNIDQSLPIEKFPILEVEKPNGQENIDDTDKDTKQERPKPMLIAGAAIAGVVAVLGWLFSEISFN